MQGFRDRTEAGTLLAEKLAHYGGRNDLIVLALPRGGVPVGFEIATALRVPLDVFVVRKLGAPGREELAIGAIASGGVRVLNDDIVRQLNIDDDEIERIARREIAELERRESAYRGGRPSPDVKGKTVIVVDDGLATGSTMRAAVQALRGLDPAKIVVAAPVGAPSVCETLAREADEVVCTLQPEMMAAISMWYIDFEQTSDDEVRELLQRAARLEA